MLDPTRRDHARDRPAHSGRVSLVNDDKWSPLRRVTPPRAVMVDPRRVWVHPLMQRRRVDPVTIGEKAASLDIRLEDEWIPAVLYAWARIRLGRDPEWYADLAIDYRSHSGLTAVTLRQWAPWDAVRLPDANESPARHH